MPLPEGCCGHCKRVAECNIPTSAWESIAARLREDGHTEEGCSSFGRAVNYDPQSGWCLAICEHWDGERREKIEGLIQKGRALAQSALL